MSERNEHTVVLLRRRPWLWWLDVSLSALFGVGTAVLLVAVAAAVFGTWTP